MQGTTQTYAHFSVVTTWSVSPLCTTYPSSRNCLPLNNPYTLCGSWTYEHKKTSCGCKIRKMLTPFETVANNLAKKKGMPERFEKSGFEQVVYWRSRKRDRIWFWKSYGFTTDSIWNSLEWMLEQTRILGFWPDVIWKLEGMDWSKAENKYGSAVCTIWKLWGLNPSWEKCHGGRIEFSPPSLPAFFCVANMVATKRRKTVPRALIEIVNQCLICKMLWSMIRKLFHMYNINVSWWWSTSKYSTAIYLDGIFSDVGLTYDSDRTPLLSVSFFPFPPPSSPSTLPFSNATGEPT